MFNVSEYLKKFARFAEDSDRARESVQKALFDVCGIEKASFEIKKGVISLSVDATMKSVVFMNKARILAEIRKMSPQSNIVDIR